MTVFRVDSNGWQLRCEYDDDTKTRSDDGVFLRLPEIVARIGMKGMTLASLQLGLRKEIWRPLSLSDSHACMSSTYPPDELFYY